MNAKDEISIMVKSAIDQRPMVSRPYVASKPNAKGAVRVGGSPGAVSTHWDPNPPLPSYQRHGIHSTCEHCGQNWYKINPKLGKKYQDMWEKEIAKSIALHMRVRHSGVKK